MFKFIVIAGIALLGLQSSFELDEIVKKDGNVSTRAALPTNDSVETANALTSLDITSVEYLYTKNNSAYTLEHYVSGIDLIVPIPLDVFPNWRAADSIEGPETRFTDTWNEVAK